jgi:hypothetical protein
LSNFSVGWRLTQSWIAQYVYSAYSTPYGLSNYGGYGQKPPSHTLVIRHEFGRQEEK